MVIERATSDERKAFPRRELASRFTRVQRFICEFVAVVHRSSEEFARNRKKSSTVSFARGRTEKLLKEAVGETPKIGSY